MFLELLWIVFGALIGWIACILQGEVKTRRIVLLILIGVSGSLAGGLFGNLIDSTAALTTGTGASSFIFSVFGAALFVVLISQTGERSS